MGCEPIVSVIRRLEATKAEPEEILTGSGQVKRLAVIEEYLVWFEDISGSSPEKLLVSSAFASNYKFHAIACLAGMLCRDLLPNSEMIAHQAQESSEPDLEAISDCHSGPNNTNTHLKLTQFGLQLTLTFQSNAGRTLIFQTPEQKQYWKAKMATSCIFFAGLASRYEYTLQLGHRNGYEVLCLRNKFLKTSHQLRLKEISHDCWHSDNGGCEKANIIKETRILLRLRNLRITPVFQELVYTKNGLGSQNKLTKMLKIVYLLMSKVLTTNENYAA